MTSEEFKIKILPWAGRLYPMIKRMLQSDAEAEDAVQEIIMKLWEKKNKLVKIENLNAYILRMARNHCLDVIKRKKTKYLEENEILKKNEQVTDYKEYEHKEKYEHVGQVINSLPEKYRLIIQYRDIDGLEFEEINALTGYEVSHIRVLLSRARVMVRNEVQKIYSYERRSD